MSENMIEKWERETGQRWDDKSGMALSGITGEIARLMGYSTHDQRDDLVAGILLTPSPEAEARERAKKMQAELFLASLGVK